jgi:pimeloyl-ACP methyl ester carboxylesterase
MKKRITLISIFISIYLIYTQSFQEMYHSSEPLLSKMSKLSNSLLPSYLSDYPTAGYQHYEPPHIKKIRDEGYDFEEHKITTEDGYILTAWRIPGKLKENQRLRLLRKPILLQHGLFDCSYTWLMLNSTNSLALLLAEEGFDVWLTNSRGNSFSHEHIDMEEYDSGKFYSKFWDFSFHEMAVYDLTANINYIKKHTGYAKINYLGHSQGTVQYFIQYTLNPEFIENSIDKFISTGTVVNVFNTVKFI